MEFFVKKDATFKVQFYVWEKDSVIDSAVEIEKVPTDVEAKTVEFTCRKPNHKDVTVISKSSLTTTMDGDLKLDYFRMADNAIRTLLLGWNLEDGEKKVEITNDSINRLDPAITKTLGPMILSQGGLI